ncbi:MAG: hypothetical protein ACKOAV_09135 [Bacteroidota bacterium]
MTSKLFRSSILLTAFLAFWSIQTWAQLVLPQPSPRCGSRLAMGVTDLEVDFGSPAVNGRVIWGGWYPTMKFGEAGLTPQPGFHSAQR